MAQKKILVVDDDKEWNLLLKIRLQASGYQVAQAFNGKEALEKIEQDQPDMILLDITMPVLSGWDVCRVLREQPKTKDMPILIHSSYNRPEDIEQGKFYQVKRFLIKPCLPGTVVQNVQDVFNSQG